MLEKFLACKGVLKFKYAVGKIEKIERNKMVESEYEIRTDLPSARARRFESDERDLSPAMFTTTRLVLENWTRTSWQLLAVDIGDFRRQRSA